MLDPPIHDAGSASGGFHTSLRFNKLLVVRTSAMGDIIHTLPAVSALREVFPAITIGWVVEERWAELLCSPTTPRFGPRSPGRPLVDAIHTVNTKAWRHSLFSPQTWRQIKTSAKNLRAPLYPVAIDFQGALRSGVLARLSGADAIYGLASPRESLAKAFYTRRVPVSGRHIVQQNCSLVEAIIGTVVETPKPQLPRDTIAEQECERYLKEHRIEKFVLLNPGAGWGAKQWPPERYGEIANQLAQDGVRCLINFGPGEERIARATEAASAGNAHRINLTITQLVAFTRRASLFIGGDTGPMHLAAALGVAVVAVFGPTNPERNGPFATPSIVLRSPLSPTTHKRVASPDPGLLTIGTDEVVAAARELLRNSRGQ